MLFVLAHAPAVPIVLRARRGAADEVGQVEGLAVVAGRKVHELEQRRALRRATPLLGARLHRTHGVDPCTGGYP